MLPLPPPLSPPFSLLACMCGGICDTTRSGSMYPPAWSSSAPAVQATQRGGADGARSAGQAHGLLAAPGALSMPSPAQPARRGEAGLFHWRGSRL